MSTLAEILRAQDEPRQSIGFHIHHNTGEIIVLCFSRLSTAPLRGVVKPMLWEIKNVVKYMLQMFVSGKLSNTER